MNKIDCMSDRSAGSPNITFVTDLTISSNQKKLACVLSNHFVNIYDIEKNACLTSIKLHTNTITSLRPSKYEDSIWFSSSFDKTFKCHDMRIPKSEVLVIRNLNEINSCSLSFNDNLLAVSQNESVNFYDMRKTICNDENSYINQDKLKPIACYNEIHSDIICDLQFSPVTEYLLFTSSEDGLLCTHDTRISNSDECCINTINANCPIRQFGTFGPNRGGLFCSTTVETLSLWHIASSQKLIDYSTIRDDFTIDYIINCLYNDVHDDLRLVCGNYDGKLQILDISSNDMSLNNRNFNNHDNGHTDMIRSVVELPNNTLATGGEDGYVCFHKM